MNKMKRRAFLKTAAYVAPAVITLAAMPSIAQSGSGGSFKKKAVKKKAVKKKAVKRKAAPKRRA